MSQYVYNPTTDDTLVFRNLKEVGKHFGIAYNTLRQWSYYGRPNLELSDKASNEPTQKNEELMSGYEIFSEKEWLEFEK